MRCDIFCRVIDNFGDIGVSWRLARQLIAEHGVTVRLWVDQLAALRALCPQVDAFATRQVVQGVEIFVLDEKTNFPPPVDLVIDAFGCGLPAGYLQSMAARDVKPLWIVLEYLSAEPWVGAHHGLPSPHPQLDLPRYFFFPGFTQGTGGVLREADLLHRRDAFDAQARQHWWAQRGFDAVSADTLAVSLFAYPHAPYAALLEACANGASPVMVAIPEGPLALRVREHLNTPGGDRARRGMLEVRFVPFVPQAAYDDLLWACDVNFVRGEDSFVRAQWAGRPFVWHIYPQADDAHRIKLDAFLDLYGAAQSMRGLWHAWNGVSAAPPMESAWQAFCAELDAQRRGLARWQAALAEVGDLAGNLLKFSQKMI